MADSVKTQVIGGGDIARVMNEAGWHDGQVRAAAILRQGESPSMTSAVVGVGLFKLFKGRAAKDLPRTFVLAITPDSAFVHKARGVSHDDSDEYLVTVWPDVLRTWPRDGLTIERGEKGINTNAILRAGGEEIPCSAQAEEPFKALEAELSGQGPGQIG
jgi:hypothetical protein